MTIVTNHIELDREQRSVRKDGEEIHLTGLEYGLLEFLSAHPNRICSRQELLDHIWGDRFQYDTGTIDYSRCRIRVSCRAASNALYD